MAEPLTVSFSTRRLRRPTTSPPQPLDVFIPSEARLDVNNHSDLMGARGDTRPDRLSLQRGVMMQVINAVQPGGEQAKDFFSGPDDGPFVMVNLLKFKPFAEYPDGSDSHITGAEAYARYTVEVRKLLASYGGRSRYAGAVTGILLGEVGELWDMIALAEYPSLAAMSEMMRCPGMQAISHHRRAGLAGQLNIRTRPHAGHEMIAEAP